MELAEEEQLQRLVEGAPSTEEAESNLHRFLSSNTRHMYADVVIGTSAYTLSGLQHMHGQSNALGLLSIWAAGTTFMMNVGLRKYLDGAVRQQKELSGVKELAAAADSASSAPTVGPIGNLEVAKRNVFKLEAVGSWVWMLSAMQQFKVHKRLKWCGYSSWMGLGCSMYFTLRHMYSILID